NVSDLAGLSYHPNVRKPWQLPCGYTLFEFYHPAFERILDNDVKVNRAARASQTARVETAAAIAEEKRILFPLFQGKSKDFQGVQLFFPGDTAFTLFLGQEEMDWPTIKLFKGWELDLAPLFRMALAEPDESEQRALETIIGEWARSGVQ